MCFGPRICEEPFPTSLTLPQDTPKYNSTAKSEDWFLDYIIAVGIARGNKHVVVRCVPLMQTGLARTRLNSLPASSIKDGVDFEEAFVRNFTDTYKRPDRPRELAMCVQAADEPLSDYFTRWTELRNSCEGSPQPARLFHSQPPRSRPARVGAAENKRKTDQPDTRYGSKQVATTKEERSAAQAASQRQRAGKGTLQPKLTFEQMLDAPCKMHSGA
ncbi:hypothetical protein ZWY2020_028963 [Hordeum vulgare]|nr:hypothetical protein ZWY2020_028963 [Hordeum vulgare]